MTSPHGLVRVQLQFAATQLPLQESENDGAIPAHQHDRISAA